MKYKNFLIGLLFIISLIILTCVNAVDAISDPKLENDEFFSFSIDIPEGSHFVHNTSQDFYCDDDNDTSRRFEYYNDGRYSKEFCGMIYYDFSADIQYFMMDSTKEQFNTNNTNIIENKSDFQVYENIKETTYGNKYVVVRYNGNENDFNQCILLAGDDLKLLKKCIMTVDFVEWK